MYNIYIANIVGAPSPTAVIVSKEPITQLKWKNVAAEACCYLRSKNINFSKMAIISLKSENIYDFKFIQIKRKNGILELESNANCGNSMIASARVVYMLKELEQGNVTLENVDTKLRMTASKNGDNFDLSFSSLIGKSINSAKIFEGSELVNVEEFENINATLIDVVNPYIIVNAKDFGVKTKQELLALNENDTKVLEKVKNFRKAIVKKYGFNENSEFPKIAIVLIDDGLAARTIYLNGWHGGLPLTAAISVAVASKMNNSVINSLSIGTTVISTPKGDKKVNIETDSEGLILKCDVYDIKSSGEISMYCYDPELDERI